MNNEDKLAPAIGIRSTVYPDVKMTLQEWFLYIGNLIIEGRMKKDNNDLDSLYSRIKP